MMSNALFMQQSVTNFPAADWPTSIVRLQTAATCVPVRFPALMHVCLSIEACVQCPLEHGCRIVATNSIFP